MNCYLSGSPVHVDSPGKNTGVDCHALIQGIFLTQGLNTLLLFHALAGRFFTTSTPWEAGIYTYMHTHTHIHTHMHAHIHTHTHMHIHNHTHTYMHTHTTYICILGMILNSKKIIYSVTYRIAFQNAVN